MPPPAPPATPGLPASAPRTRRAITAAIDRITYQPITPAAGGVRMNQCPPGTSAAHWMHDVRNVRHRAAAWLNTSEPKPLSGAHSRLITPAIRMTKAAGITSRFMASATGENKLKK